MRGLVVALMISLLTLASCVPTLTPGPKPTGGEVKILSQSGYISSAFPGTYAEIFGEVQNVGKNNLEYIRLTATFYDSQGEVLRSEWTYVWTDILLPGEKSPFSFIKLIAERDYKSYGVVVTEYRETDAQPYRAFQFPDHSSYIADDGYYRVKGSIKNTGLRDIDFLDVVVTFRDAEGKVLSAGIYPIADLPAGGTDSFDQSALPKGISSKIASYTLQTKVSP